MHDSEIVEILWQKLNGRIFLNPFYIPLFLRYRVVRGAASSGWGSYYATRKNLVEWIHSGSLLSFRTYCLLNGKGDRRRATGKKGAMRYGRLQGVLVSLLFGWALGGVVFGSVTLWGTFIMALVCLVCYTAIGGLFGDGNLVGAIVALGAVMLVAVWLMS